MTDKLNKIEPWTILSSQELCKTKFFRLRDDKCEMPNKHIVPNYYVIEWKPWCNVVALTENGEMILIEQYRHAAGKVCIEIPGGQIDHGSPIDAIKRELLEETGYSSDEVTHVGTHYPNPAMLTNQLHTFVAKNCRKTSDLKLDEFEDIRVFTLPVKTAYALIDAGKIDHSLIIASMYLAQKYLT